MNVASGTLFVGNEKCRTVSGSTLKLVVVCLLQQELQLTEVVRQERPAGPHEVQDVLEHLPVPTVR